MRQPFSIGLGKVFLLAGCVVLFAFPVMVEPILGGDSLGTSTADSATNKTADDALASFRIRDFDGALQLWREAVKEDPDLPPAQAIMGQLFLRANMLEDAKRALEKAIKETPDDPEVYLVLGTVHLRNRELDQAETMLRKTEELLPDFDKSAKRKALLQVQLLGNQAVLAEVREDWASAEQFYASLLETNPKNIGAITQMAFCQFRQDRIDDALEQLQTLQEIATGALVPEAVMAQFYDRVGDREKAVQWMAKAVQAAPENYGTRLLAGQWALKARRFDEARKHAAAATRLKPKSIEALMLQGMVAMLEKNFMAAELFFDAALRQAPESLGLRNNLALALIEQNDESKEQRALELAEENLKTHPDTPQFASTYGHILYRLGRLEEAEEALRTAAPIIATDLDTAYVFACLAAERGRKEEARRLLGTGLDCKNTALFRQEAKIMLEKLNEEKE